ncbi:MAG: hypothetical protein R2746_08720 [Acidimicrobiales bacterium]
MTRPDPDARQRAGQAFLVASAIGAANTANARRPLKQTGRAGGVLGFFPGGSPPSRRCTPSRGGVVATLVFARRSLRTRRGLIGLGVSLASWSALVVWRRSLGPATSTTPPCSRPGRRPRPGAARRGAAHPWRARPPSHRRRALKRWKRRYVHGPSIRYGDAGLPTSSTCGSGRTARPPARRRLCWCRCGGAWVIGNKEQRALPLLAHMAGRGWVCVSINYRLTPGHLARPHRRREAGPRVGEGEHRRPWRRPRLRVHHRRIRRRPLLARRAAERAGLPTQPRMPTPR